MREMVFLWALADRMDLPGWQGFFKREHRSHPWLPGCGTHLHLDLEQFRHACARLVGIR